MFPTFGATASAIFACDDRPDEIFDSRFVEACAIMALISSFVEDKGVEPHGFAEPDGSVSLDNLASAALCGLAPGSAESPNIAVAFCGVVGALSGTDERALPLELNQVLSIGKLDDGVSVW